MWSTRTYFLWNFKHLTKVSLEFSPCKSSESLREIIKKLKNNFFQGDVTQADELKQKKKKLNFSIGEGKSLYQSRMLHFTFFFVFQLKEKLKLVNCGTKNGKKSSMFSDVT